MPRSSDSTTSTSGAVPSAALLKATLVNGARWLTGADSIADRVPAPISTRALVNQFDTSLPNPAEPGLRLESVDCWETPNLQLGETGERRRFHLDVGGGMPLRLCLASTDLPGRSAERRGLLVPIPRGQDRREHRAARSHRFDVDNNVEMVRIDDPTPGRWRSGLRRNMLRPPQDYALVATRALSSPLRRAPG